MYLNDFENVVPLLVSELPTDWPFSKGFHKFENGVALVDLKAHDLFVRNLDVNLNLKNALGLFERSHALGRRQKCFNNVFTFAVEMKLTGKFESTRGFQAFHFLNGLDHIQIVLF
jgi:hypothetical protein